MQVYDVRKLHFQENLYDIFAEDKISTIAET